MIEEGRGRRNEVVLQEGRLEGGCGAERGGGRRPVGNTNIHTLKSIVGADLLIFEIL